MDTHCEYARPSFCTDYRLGSLALAVYQNLTSYVYTFFLQQPDDDLEKSINDSLKAFKKIKDDLLMKMKGINGKRRSLKEKFEAKKRALEEKFNADDHMLSKLEMELSKELPQVVVNAIFF